MARLTDPDTLARYHKALSEWNVEGPIELVGIAHEGLRSTLEGVTVTQFKEVLYHFICHQQGEIDQVKEEREPWRQEWEWHYDLRPTIQGVQVYVETRLFPESFSSRQETIVYVVQIKPA